MTLQISNQVASTAISAVAAQLNSGFLDIYAGTKPADANTNTSGAEFILYEYTFSSVAGVVVTSTATMQFVSSGATTATSTGTSTFFGLYSSSRARLGYGTVSTASADFNVSANNVVSGVSASVTSYALVLPE